MRNFLTISKSSASEIGDLFEQEKYLKLSKIYSGLSKSGLKRAPNSFQIEKVTVIL